MIYKPGFGIQKFLEWHGLKVRRRQHGDLISLPLFFQNKKNRPKVTFCSKAGLMYKLNSAHTDFKHFVLCCYTRLLTYQLLSL
jgi:hypothetical protein